MRLTAERDVSKGPSQGFGRQGAISEWPGARGVYVRGHGLGSEVRLLLGSSSQVSSVPAGLVAPVGKRRSGRRCRGFWMSGRSGQ